MLAELLGRDKQVVDQTMVMGDLNGVVVRYDMGVERLVEGTATSAPGLSIRHERKEPLKSTPGEQ